METQTLNGVTYQRSGPGETWKRFGAPSGGRMIPKSGTTVRKEGADADKSVIEAQEGAATLPYAAPTAAANLGKTEADTAFTQEQLDEAVEKRERGNISDEKRQGALRAYTSADFLERLADKLEREMGRNLGRTSGIAGAMDFVPAGENTRINQMANSSRGYLKSALGFTGGEGNAAIEQENNYGSYIPSNWDSNETAAAKIANLRNLARQSRVESISFLGGVPDAAGRIDRLPEGLNQNQLDRLYQGQNVKEVLGADDYQGLGDVGETGSATANGGFTKVPGLGGLPKDVIRMVRRGATADDILKHLNEAYADAGVDGQLAADPETRAFIQGVINDHAKNPDAPISSLASGWDRLTGYETPKEETGFLGGLLGSAQESPAAAGVISAANAVTGGNLANLAGGDSGDVMAAMRRDNPKSSFAGDVFGSGLAMYGINRLGGPLARAGGIGGDMLYGGTRGFSETEGDLGDRATGGLFGLAAAGVGNQVGQHLLAPTIRGVANTAPGRAVADFAANTGTGIGNAFRGVRGQSPVPYQGAGIPETSVARSVISRNLPEEVDPLVAALEQGRAINMPMTLADVSPRLRNVGGAAFRRSDQGTQEEIAQLLTDRARGQAGRAQGQLEASFGPLDDPLVASRSLMEGARREADPLYEAFRAQPARTSPELQAMLSTPAGQRALQNARTTAANEGRDPNAMGFDLDELGQVVLRSDPSPETIDLVKRGFDDVLEGYRDGTTGRLNLDEGGRAIEGLRQRYVAEADRLYPDTYPQARAAFAGPASENAALSAGQSMVGKIPRQVGRRMEGMTPSQLEQFRLGQRSAMGDAVQGAKTSSDPYQRIWGDPMDYERASLVFGAPSAQRFQQAFDAEQAMGQTRNAFIGGSPTQGRQALDEQLSDQIGGQMANAAIETITTGSPTAAGLGFAQRFLRDRQGLGFRGAREESASEIAQLLATERPVDEIAQLLSETAAYRRYVDNIRNRGGHVGAALVPGALASGGAYE